MKFLLYMFISSLLLELFVPSIQARSGSGSDESGSGSNESHRRHGHSKHRNGHYTAPDSNNYQHYNHPAYIPQLSPYPAYYGMPPFPYSGYYNPMHQQIPYYGIPQAQYQLPQIPGAAYANSGYYHPSVAAATQAAPGYPGFAGFQYTGQAVALPPQVAQASLGHPQSSGTQSIGLPLAPQPQVPQAATGNEQNLGQAQVEGRQLPKNVGGDVSSAGGTGVSSSSLNHHLKVNQEYAEDGHKHSVNQF